MVNRRAGGRSGLHGNSLGAENPKRRSTSIRLQKRPDVVEVLEDVKVSTASPEHRAKRDVTAFDEQGPRERSFIVREFCDEWSSWHQ